jgi:hypothetical protein
MVFFIFFILVGLVNFLEVTESSFLIGDFVGYAEGVDVSLFLGFFFFKPLKLLDHLRFLFEKLKNLIILIFIPCVFLFILFGCYCVIVSHQLSGIHDDPRFFRVNKVLSVLLQYLQKEGNFQKHSEMLIKNNPPGFPLQFSGEGTPFQYTIDEVFRLQKLFYNSCCSRLTAADGREIYKKLLDLIYQYDGFNNFKGKSIIQIFDQCMMDYVSLLQENIIFLQKVQGYLTVIFSCFIFIFYVCLFKKTNINWELFVSPLIGWLKPKTKLRAISIYFFLSLPLILLVIYKVSVPLTFFLFVNLYSFLENFLLFSFLNKSSYFYSWELQPLDYLFLFSQRIIILNNPHKYIFMWVGFQSIIATILSLLKLLRKK